MSPSASSFLPSELAAALPLSPYILALAAAYVAYVLLMPKKEVFDPKGKHCLVTGGSQGLGLALAKELVKQGAHVTIVARNESKLSSALSELEALRLSPSQHLTTVSADLSRPEPTNAAFATASATAALATGRAVHPPEYVFCCAGASTPGWFLEVEDEVFERDMGACYWSGLWTARAAARLMVQHRIPSGKIIFVSSLLGLPLGVPGYSPYAPAKHALRGLADQLRTELQLYGIAVHIHFPGTIYSPGFEREQETRPGLTKEIEGPDEGLVPEECARGLLRGLKKNRYMITTDWIGHLLAPISRGTSPRGNALVEGTLGLIAYLAFPIWYKYMEHVVRKGRAKHLQELRMASVKGQEELVPAGKGGKQ